MLNRLVARSPTAIKGKVLGHRRLGDPIRHLDFNALPPNEENIMTYTSVELTLLLFAYRKSRTNRGFLWLVCVEFCTQSAMPSRQ